MTGDNNEIDFDDDDDFDPAMLDEEPAQAPAAEGVALGKASDPASVKPAKAAKASGGGGKLVKMALVLAVLGGGGFAYLKMTGTDPQTALKTAQQNVTAVTEGGMAALGNAIDNTQDGTGQAAGMDMADGGVPPMPGMDESPEMADAGMMTPPDDMGSDDLAMDSMEDDGMGGMGIAAPTRSMPEVGETGESMADTDDMMAGTDDGFAIDETAMETMADESMSDDPSAADIAMPGMDDMAESVDMAADMAMDAVEDAGAEMAGMAEDMADDVMDAAEDMADMAAPDMPEMVAAEVIETAPAPESAPVAAVTNTMETTPVAAASAAPAASNAEVNALKSRLSGVEGQVAALQRQISGLQGTMLTKADLDALRRDIQNLRSETSRKMASAPKAASKTRSAARAPSKSKTASAAPRKVAPVKADWVLKSAKPGVAWIAKGKSRELKQIKVGESLAGIGKILSIDKNDSGNWMVKGSKDNIGQ